MMVRFGNVFLALDIGPLVLNLKYKFWLRVAALS